MNLARVLDTVVIAPPVAAGNLTMVPLLRAPQAPVGPASPDYVLLDHALASGLVEITEVSEEGSVPHLRVVNRGARPVLIVDGEELLGASQSGVVNLTILVPAAAELTIPVSCVEAGRSTPPRRSPPALWTLYASGRARRMAQVSESMLLRGDRVAKHTDVWNDLSELSRRTSAPSPTSAMEALYSLHAPALDEFVAVLQPVVGQVGAMFAVADNVLGFDLFDRPSTLRDMLPKLVRRAAIDALDAAGASASRSGLQRLSVAAQAGQFLEVTADARPHVAPALALGHDVRLTTPYIAGAALALDAHLIYLSAFAL